MEITKLSNLNIFDTLLEPLFAFNANNEIIYCNNVAANFLETTERKILKIKQFHELIKTEKVIPEIMQLDSIKDSTSYKEYSFLTLTGKPRQVLYSFQLILLNNEKIWIMYFRDQTLEQTLHEKYHNEYQEKENYVRKLEVAHRELEKHSHNLKKLVDERTGELGHLNSMMGALLDSLEPAFFMFDVKGICLPVYSKSCIKIIEKEPSGQFVWDILKIENEKIIGFKNWIETIFNNPITFDKLSLSGPNIFPSNDDLHIELRYFPLINEVTQKLDAIVVMATDNTQIDIAKEIAEKERNYAMMMVNILKRRKEMIQFVFDTQRIIDELRKTLNDQFSFNLQVVFRCFHTIKGGASSFSIHDLTKACHEAEHLLLDISHEGLSKESLTHLNEHFSNIRYQFQNFLKSNEIFLGSSIIHGIRTIEIPVQTLTLFLRKIHRFPEAREYLQKFEREIFYVPIKQFFEGYNDAIQSLAQRLGKKVKPLMIDGGDIPVHREIYAEMFATFIHQFNNIIDHGIEEPNLRRFHHKDEQGEIRISVNIQPMDDKEFLIIRIKDDGQGIDSDKIRKKFASNGVDLSHENDEEVIQHVFDSQFTTKNAVTLVSGRGIGMDAILYSAYAIGGTAFVRTELQKGTELWIRVPYAKESIKLGAA